MRSLAALALALLAAIPLPAIADGGGTRPIDAAESSAHFDVTHVFVEHVTGSVPIVSGSITLAPHATIPAAATAVLDATKLSTGDHDRDGELRSPDFFDVTRFGTWTFTSTSITAAGPGAFGMDGKLTIHGVTQPEHLDVTVRGDADHPVYHATGKIDRRAFGMAVTRLDPAIGQIVDVTLDVVLVSRDK